jgi:hypothetical protein
LKKGEIVKHILFILLIFLTSCDFLGDLLGLNTKLDAVAIESSEDKFYVTKSYQLVANYKDPEKESPTIYWSLDNGVFLNNDNIGDTVTWIAPNTVSEASITIEVKSDKGSSKTSRKFIVQNRKPRILGFRTKENIVIEGNNLRIIPIYSEPDGGNLTFEWTVPTGTYSKIDSNGINWTAPFDKGLHKISLRITDNNGLWDTLSTNIVVYRVQGSILVANTASDKTFIKHFSEEGHLLHTVEGLTSAKKIVIDQDNLNFWVLDDMSKSLNLYNYRCEKIGEYTELINPRDIALNTDKDHGMWILDDSTAYLIDKEAKSIRRTIRGFKIPKKISVGNGNDIFVSDVGDYPAVYSIDASYDYSLRSSSRHRIISGFESITDISFDKIGKKLWISDGSSRKLWQMDKDSTNVVEVPESFTTPYFFEQDNIVENNLDVAITWMNDDHHLIVFHGINGAKIEFDELEKEIGGIAIITYNNENEAWVTRSHINKIVRIKADGTKVKEISGVKIPKSIQVYNGN